MQNIGKGSNLREQYKFLQIDDNLNVKSQRDFDLVVKMMKKLVGGTATTKM